MVQTFYLDGYKLPNHGRQSVLANGSMVIENAHKLHDEGFYTCTARNQHDDSHSGTVQIEVLSKWHIPTFPSEASTFFCQASCCKSFPSAATLLLPRRRRRHAAVLSVVSRLRPLKTIKKSLETLVFWGPTCHRFPIDMEQPLDECFANFFVGEALRHVNFTWISLSKFWAWADAPFVRRTP